MPSQEMTPDVATIDRRRPRPCARGVALAFLLSLTSTTAAAQGELLGYWRFDGDALDSSGAGRHLGLAGSPSYAAGLFGQSLELNGSGAQYAVRPGDDPAFDFGAADFTIQARVWFDSIAGEQVLIEKFSNSSGPGWTLTKLDSQRLHFYASPAIVLTSGVLSITTSEWHHVVARRNGTSFEVWYDGVLVASGTGAGVIPDTTAPLLLGRRNAGDGRIFALDGRLDEVALWSCGLPGASLATSEPVLVPTAHAGSDQSVAEAAFVTLSGGGSSAGCGVPTFTWTQVLGIGGTGVTLDVTDPLHPSFTAPFVASGGETLTFQLTVTVGAYTSAPAFVDVMVTNMNRPPVALAGDDQSVNEASPVTLDGSSSYDPDSDPLTFLWTQVGGAPVTLDLADPVRPTFTSPFVGASGDVLVFELLASDAETGTTDRVEVTVENVNHPPIAAAGADVTTTAGSPVALDGSASSDPDSDPLAFTWTQVSGPAVALVGDTTATPSFVAPLVGATLTFQVTVDDGLGGLASDDVTVTVMTATTPPDCSLARPSVTELWPPNHGLVPVSILGVTDPNGGGVTVTILNVTQDEPVDGLGDGDTAPDAVLQAGGTVLLRAERAGGGNGRVYRVHFQVETASGGVCTGAVNVCVPRSRGRNAPASVDDGQVYSSL